MKKILFLILIGLIALSCCGKCEHGRGLVSTFKLKKAPSEYWHRANCGMLVRVKILGSGAMDCVLDKYADPYFGYENTGQRCQNKCDVENKKWEPSCNQCI